MKVVVKPRDDGTDPAKASQVMHQLIDDGVVAIVGPAGTSNNLRMGADREGGRGPGHRRWLLHIDGNGDEDILLRHDVAIIEGLIAR